MTTTSEDTETEKREMVTTRVSPKHRAIVLCKLRHTDALKELAIRKNEDACHYAERYQIAWSELQELKKRFGDFGRDHFKVPDVN